MMNIVLSENKFKQGQIYEAKRKRVISWTMVILMMAVIFLFSAKTADASEQMSMGVTQWISKLVGISPAEAGGFGNSLYDMLSVMDHYVRKTAHFLEIRLLGVLVCRALGIDVKKRLIFWVRHWRFVLSMP